MSTKFDSTYSAVLSLAEQLIGEGKYDSTYSAVLSIYQNLTSDVDTKFDSVYSIVVNIAEGIENGSINIGGGSGSEEEDFSPKIRFFDFDGNIVESWTLDEAKTKTENDFPTLGNIGFGSFNLNFDGWNTPIEDINNTTSDIAVGSMWKPSDGNSWIKVNIEPENLTTVLFIEVLGDCVIDWGDGTTDDADTISGFPEHTYASVGEKWIKIIGDWNPDYGSNQGVIYNNYPAWYYWKQVTHIFLGRDVGEYNFDRMSSLQYITFPNIQHKYSNLTNSLDFAYCSSLKNLYLPYGDGDMKQPSSSTGSPFFRCDNLEVLSWRGWWNRKGELYQLPLNSLRYTTIHHTVTMIGSSAFSGCHSLKSATLPNSVTSIGASVFYSNYSLKSVTLPNSVISINNDAFNHCETLESITLSNTITSIPFGMCRFCYSLKSINIPNSVTSISEYAFGDVSYSRVDFSQNTQVPTLLSTSAFGSTAIILVPESLYDEWISATNWSSLSSQIKPVPGK